MPSIYITDWKYGMDRRRKRVAGVPGTLWTGQNVQVSRGGDLERPKRFTATYTLPAAQTFGLGAVGGQIYVFGSVATPGGMPNGVQYQRCQAPSGAAMTQVLDVKAANGQLYVIAAYADGNIFHFYNGARVTDWDALATTNGTFGTLAIYLADLINADSAVTAIAAGQVVTITANTPGTAFTCTQSTVDHGGTNDQTITLATLQANVSAVAETVATGTVTITGGSALAGTNRVTDVLINGASTMYGPADWTLSNAATANRVASQINNKSATTGYTAVAVGAVVTISAKPGTGATPNGFTVSPTLAGSVTASSTAMAGGVTAVTAIAQITTATLGGTYEGSDLFNIVVNGTTYAATGNASGTGRSLYVHQKRIWSTAGSLAEYCKINVFTNWSDAGASSGAGFLNVANDAEGSEPLVGAGTFLGQVAFFSRRNTRLYNIPADATAISIVQPIDNSGALSSRSIMGYGTTDTFYLDETGIRSLKPRDASNAAFVNDLGNPIDTFVRAQMDALPFGTIQRACATIEPRDGRFWLAIGPNIYVLSFFPGSQISAWTYFTPGFTVSDFARAYNRLYVRSADQIYLYGGASGSEYAPAGEMTPYVELPFAATSPPARGMLLGFDMASTGTWQVQMLVDPNNEVSQIDAGAPSGVTYGNSDDATPGSYSHMALNMTCLSGGAATISNVAIHHDGSEPNV